MDNGPLLSTKFCRIFTNMTEPLDYFRLNMIWNFLILFPRSDITILEYFATTEISGWRDHLYIKQKIIKKNINVFDHKNLKLDFMEYRSG